MWECYLRHLWNPYPSCTEREHCLPDFVRFGENFWQRWVLHSIKAPLFKRNTRQVLENNSEFLLLTKGSRERKRLPITWFSNWAWSKAGFVLSPTLFLVLINSLLQKLKGANTGVAVEGVFFGSMGHADDIRSLTCDPQSKQLSSMIFWQRTSCRWIHRSVHSHGGVPKDVQLEVGSVTLKPTTASKWLGTWWTSDLKSITENIFKAEKAFGCIGVFQGELNPFVSICCGHMCDACATVWFRELVFDWHFPWKVGELSVYPWQEDS